MAPGTLPGLVMLLAAAAAARAFRPPAPAAATRRGLPPPRPRPTPYSRTQTTTTTTALGYRAGPDFSPRNATMTAAAAPEVPRARTGGNRGTAGLERRDGPPPSLPWSPPPSIRRPFEVTSPHLPAGDQPRAIERLVAQIRRGDKYSVLRGATGTGKTHVLARTLESLRSRPALVLCHNKTLAAQLARELRSLLSKNHVHLFVSYYNHYVPESYSEKTGRYVSKKSAISDELNALRHLATRALVQHDDVVVVASVSCIYGLGLPSNYLDAAFKWRVDRDEDEEAYTEDEIAGLLDGAMYLSASKEGGGGDDGDDEPTPEDVKRGEYRTSHCSDGTMTVRVWPPTERAPVRVDFRRSTDRDDADGRRRYAARSIRTAGAGLPERSMDDITIFPARHHAVSSKERLEESLSRIQDELTERLRELRAASKTEEANRLSLRVSQDLMLLRETGTCSGIENYSRHLALRGEGEPPETLLDYFGSKDFLLFVDESHVGLHQLAAMYRGDRARKEALVKHGHRLPSALDNRPLKEDEFWERISQAVFVSATPGRKEMDLIAGIPRNEPIDMVIRPTFVCDPPIDVRPTAGQLEDLVGEVKARADRNERSLALALRKKDAEDLAGYLNERGVRAGYIHCGLRTRERSEVLQALQRGDVDCLVGVNLLREGLDLPEVSLVAILNADVEGFLRSETSLLQTVGRAARNRSGRAILYADRTTEGMRRCIELTRERRRAQLAYNAANGKESSSTKGSSFAPIFDLLKDEIEQETGAPEGVATATKPKHRGVAASDDGIDASRIPKSPGVYFWKDAGDKILYIGKAKNLRSRVGSYLLPSANHGPRIKAMMQKKTHVDFIVTPSERDALILEANLISHHRPPYNVLLRDDESYPLICATVGEDYPEFRLVPRRHMGDKAHSYKYFGPYPKHSDVSTILEGIERTYNLRSLSFESRFGDRSKEEYQSQFTTAVGEVFEEGDVKGNLLYNAGKEGVEGNIIFDSSINSCRDVVVAIEGENEVFVSILQLRCGLVMGQFSYTHSFEQDGDGSIAEAVVSILAERHYPVGEAPIKPGFSFFPDEILLQYKTSYLKEIKRAILTNRELVEPDRKSKVSIRKAAARGPRSKIDQRVLDFALENARLAAKRKKCASYQDAAPSSVNGCAAQELQDLLSLPCTPKRLEGFDISHMQGDSAVGSRTVFVNGRPAPHLYRRFNVKSVADRRDDLANLEEVLERRFLRARSTISPSGLVNDEDPWSMPDVVVVDGGKGQLSASLRGMAKAGVFPSNVFRNSTEDGMIVEEDESDILALPDSGYSPVFVPVVALAKREEELFSPRQSEPVNRNAISAAMLLLRALRDESHRFAVSEHRKLYRRNNYNLPPKRASRNETEMCIAAQ